MKGQTEVFWDPFDPSIIENPYPAYQALRDHSPIYHNEERGFWALSRFDDVQFAARDWRTFSTKAGTDLDETDKEFGEAVFLQYDPPRHDMLRNVVRDPFAPKSIKALEETVKAKTEELITPFVERGSVDAVTEFAGPLPLRMIIEILGLPQEDEPMLSETLLSFLVRYPNDPTIPQVALDASSRLKYYLAEKVADRRRRPDSHEGLLRSIVTAELEGDRLSDEECTSLCYFLFVAGVDTVTALISNSLLLLAKHPEQRATLVENPAMVPDAIEELVRYESPLHQLARITTRPVELHDRIIPEGERIALLFGSANRDERKFDDPDRLDVTRKIKRHLAFGEGIHHCLGAPLARLEGRIALQTFLASIPQYELAGLPERIVKQNQWGLRRLPLAF